MNKSLSQFSSFIAMASIFILSTIFLVSAVLKIMDPESFVIAISYYRLFPLSLLNMSAIFLIMLEFTVAVTLWIPSYRKASALIISGLMAFFIIIIFIAIIRGLDISCGCFGDESQKVGFKKIGENTILLILALRLAFSPKKESDL